nr:hypothetical protein [Candidatus Cloacimonadota bacterium]
MKRNQMLFLLTLCLLICFSSSLSALVTIDYTYNVTSNTTINDDVLITSNGIVQSSGWDYWLTVNGSITNEGIIRNDPVGYSLFVNVSGNIINNGTWSCRKTYLSGSSPKHISCGSTNNFSSFYFYNNSEPNIIADSDLNFVGAQIDFQNNGSLDISSGYNLSISGGYLVRTTVIGETSCELYMDNNAYLTDVIISDIILTGTTNIGSNIVTFQNNLINNNILQNSGYNYDVHIEGDFTNNGTVRNNPGGYSLRVYVSGNATNNGIWSCHFTYLNGSSQQHISCGSTDNFSSLYFYNNNSQNIIADSDLNFVGAQIDFQ